MIIEAEATLQIPDMMAALFVLMIVGVILVVAVRAVQSRLLLAGAERRSGLSAAATQAPVRPGE